MRDEDGEGAPAMLLTFDPFVNLDLVPLKVMNSSKTPTNLAEVLVKGDWGWELVRSSTRLAERYYMTPRNMKMP